MLCLMKPAARLLSFTGVLVFLLPVSGKELKATFSMSEIKGTITFTQSDDPTTETTMKLDLEGIDIMLDLRIHEIPMIYNGDASTSCSTDAVGPVFDPTSWNTTSTCSTVNKKNCAVGDLSGKFGVFQSGNSKDTNPDQTLPLSGKNSIYGRTILFTTTSDVPKACAIITSDTKATYAVAYFKEPVAGTVYFRQDGSAGDTLVYINLFYVYDSVIKREYFLKIHSKSVSEKTTSDQCSNIGQLVNQAGNLETKIGSFNVTNATSGLSSTQVARVDVDLPVNDGYTVGHSLVLYPVDDPNNPTACTNILKLLPMKAKAVFTEEATDGVSGTFVFSQDSPFDPTTIDINIKNLRQKAQGFHVHEYPNPSYKGITDNTQACSAASAGDHLNPYKIVASNSPVSGTLDQYEIGDLSAKHGSFLNNNNRVGRYSDLNLPLFGNNSLVGRSIVIHKLKKDGNKRWVCRNIDLDMTDVTKMETRSHFTGPEIQGDIVMTQYKSSDDKAAPLDTTIYLDLKLINGEKTLNHNWHVHDNPVGDDMNKGMFDGRCTSLGPHYNPFNVYVKGDYAEICTPNNPLRCELGDSSAKQSRYNLGYGPRFYSDVDTPLFGVHSVVGRGFVVHSRDKDDPRQGCADIEANATLFKEKILNIVKPSGVFSKDDFVTKIAFLINSPKWRIFYVRNTAGHKAKCSTIRFGIIGDDIASEYDKLVRNYASRLKPYQPDSDCNHSKRSRLSLSLLTAVTLFFLAVVF